MASASGYVSKTKEASASGYVSKTKEMERALQKAKEIVPQLTADKFNEITECFERGTEDDIKEMKEGVELFEAMVLTMKDKIAKFEDKTTSVKKTDERSQVINLKIHFEDKVWDFNTDLSRKSNIKKLEDEVARLANMSRGKFKLRFPDIEHDDFESGALTLFKLGAKDGMRVNVTKI